MSKIENSVDGNGIAIEMVWRAYFFRIRQI
jgi:hypothetical protein